MKSRNAYQSFRQKPQHRLPCSEALQSCSVRADPGHFTVMWARNILSRTLFKHKISLSRDNYVCCRSFTHAPFTTIRMASTLPRLPIFLAIKSHDAQSTAVIHSLSGRRFTYGELVNDVAAAKDKLQRNTNGSSAEGQRISFLVENGYDYVGAHSSMPTLHYKRGQQLTHM